MMVAARLPPAQPAASPVRALLRLALLRAPSDQVKDSSGQCKLTHVA